MFNPGGPAGPTDGLPVMQHCYVTGDIERAMDAMKSVYGADRFHLICDNQVPHSQGGHAHTHVALAWVGNVQMEIIQPLGGRDEIYREYLSDGGPLMVFHHECKLARNWDEFTGGRRHFEQLGCEIGFARESGPYRTFYADTRRFFGHFIEYVWLEDEAMLTMNGAMPCY